MSPVAAQRGDGGNAEETARSRPDRRYKSEPGNQGRIDFDALRETARQHRPKMIGMRLLVLSARLRLGEFKAIADEVGALTMADVSHIGGLIAGGVMRNPCDHGFDFVTTTTHKSLRGPRGGMILRKKAFRRDIDRSVFPGLQGGPHMNQVAGTAIVLGKALEPEFADYARRVLDNAQTLRVCRQSG